MATRTTNYGLYKPDPTDDYVDFLSEFNANMDEIDEHLGSGGSGGVKILRSQSLSFTGLVATVSDSDITADSNYIVYYHDVTLAEAAGITTVASSGVITFTATTAPSNTIVVDIVLLDVNGGGGGSGGHTIIDPLGQNMPSRTGLQFIGASVTDDSVNDKTVVTITGGGVHYSTSEQVIGTWIDGKPVYQRTWTGTKNNNSDEAVISDLLNVDVLVDSRVTFKGNTGSQIVQYYRDTNDRARIWLDGGDLKVHMDSGNGYPILPITWYITLQYTKTTD